MKTRRSTMCSDAGDDRDTSSYSGYDDRGKQLFSAYPRSGHENSQLHHCKSVPQRVG